MASRAGPPTQEAARVSELETEVEELRERAADLESQLATAERERDAAIEWAAFLEGEVRAYRERVAELERGPLARLRRLLP